MSCSEVITFMMMFYDIIWPIFFTKKAFPFPLSLSLVYTQQIPLKLLTFFFLMCAILFTHMKERNRGLFLFLTKKVNYYVHHHPFKIRFSVSCLTKYVKRMRNCLYFIFELRNSMINRKIL